MNTPMLSALSSIPRPSRRRRRSGPGSLGSDRNRVSRLGNAVRQRSADGNFQPEGCAASEDSLLAVHGKEIGKRLPAFDLAEKLVAQAAGLAEQPEWLATLSSIRANRSLLDNPDPVSHVLKAAANALRAKVADVHKAHGDVFKEQTAQIVNQAAWKKLSEEKAPQPSHQSGGDGETRAHGCDGRSASLCTPELLAGYLAGTDRRLACSNCEGAQCSHC